MKNWFAAPALLALALAAGCLDEADDGPPGMATSPDARPDTKPDAAPPDSATVVDVAIDLVPPSGDTGAPDRAPEVASDLRGWDAGEVGPGAGCLGEPAPGNVAVPFFGAIFTGRYRVWNHFDHDEPKQFVDKNGVQIDWCGRRRTNQIDGHNGYDFMMPEGIAIYAPAAGVVTAAGVEPPFFCPLKNSMVTDQTRLEILHTLPDGRRVYTVYKHLSRTDVATNQRVNAGQTIGLTGNRGCSTGPHLHMEAWMADGTPTGRPVVIDPFGWEGVGVDPWAARPDGMPSIWLWKPGQAPDLYAN